MPRTTVLTDDQVEYLRSGIETGTYLNTMASEIGVCRDTLKRLLDRHGLKQYDSVKHGSAPRTATWTRPCIGCKSTQRRPKNHYFCSRCRQAMGYGECA